LRVVCRCFSALLLSLIGGLQLTPRPSPLSLHDALPISGGYSSSEAGMRPPIQHREQRRHGGILPAELGVRDLEPAQHLIAVRGRSEEHTSELQSREKIVCLLLLEKKKTKQIHNIVVDYS